MIPRASGMNVNHAAVGGSFGNARKARTMSMTDSAYDQRYAADMKHEALVEAVARALCDECYGAGSFESLSHGEHGAAQVHSWKKQARVAVKICCDWL